MALQRRWRKFHVGNRPIFFTVAVFLVSVLMVPVVLTALPGLRSGASATERVVNDRFTGLAISGYDPVAYFTDAKPVVGSPVYEKSFMAVVWRFRNDGNRAVFSANPDIYQPRYGGYDPTGVARGVALAGNPLLWAIAGERLYLFYSEEDRFEFVANPQSVIAAADGRWQRVRQDLSN